jgi:predicted AlkP superfamily pyrophosphatase or phosphodiesterase
MGDHLLHHVLRTESANVRWPPANSDGVSVESRRDAYGYATNAAVEPHLLEGLGDPTIDFVFCQLKEVDTLGHLGGPLNPSTLECCATTDNLVGEILEALRPEWQRALVIVVSDHDMVYRSSAPAIDLLDDARVRAVVRDVFVDGDAALVQVLARVDPATACDALAAVDGVETVERLDDNVLVVAAGPTLCQRPAASSGVARRSVYSAHYRACSRRPPMGA